jgi:hypothetical protein
MALDPVIIRFAASGVGDVSSACAQVGSQIRKLEERATRERQVGSSARSGVTRKEVSVEERAYAKLQKDLEKYERQQTKDVERESKRREAVIRKTSEMTGREAAKAADVEIREAKRASREVEREEERKRRIRIRSSEMAGRAAEREATQETAAARAAAAERRTLGNRVGGIVNRSVGGMARSALSIAGASIGIGGGLMLASAARSEMTAERTAALLVNAGTNGGVAPGTVNQALGEASAQSKALGMSKDDLLKGALTYSQNARGGDFKGALANMGFFGKMAKVTGADINDIASAAGTLQSQNYDVLGKDPAKMQQLLLNTLAQAHQGSMSMVDAAKQFGTLGATRSYYKGDVTANQQTLIGLGQIAKNAGDAGESGTFIKDIATEAYAANRKFKKKHGKDLVHIDAKTGQLDSPEAVVEQVLRATKGNIGEISEAFGQRGSRLFGELAGTFQKAGGGEAGISAVKKNMGEVTGATMTVDQLNQQNAQVDSTPGMKLQLAFNKISETLEDKLEPRLDEFASNTLPKLIPIFEKIIDAGASFADWFADNPIKGVGAIVLAKVTADLAAAGIGEGVKQVLIRLMAGSALPGGAGGGAGGMGVLGKVGAVAGAAAAGAGVAMMITDADIDEKTNRQKGIVSNSNEAFGDAQSVMGKIKRGEKVTAADVARLQAEASSMGTQAAAAKGRIGQNEMGMAQTGMAFLTGHGGELRALQTQNQKAEYEQLRRSHEATAKAAEMATKALQQLAAAVPRGPLPVQSGAPRVPIPNRPL